MRTVDRSEFLPWLTEAGIGVDPKWLPEWPRDLGFGGVDLPRYWITPQSTRDLLFFIATMLDALGAWNHAYLWGRSSSWITDLEEDDALCRVMVRCFPRECSTDGAIEFSSSERDVLESMMLCACAFGWSWPNDVFIVADQRDVVLKTDHHDVIWAEFKTVQRRDEFVAAMAAAGFDLPKSRPDPTFRAVPGQDVPEA